MSSTDTVKVLGNLESCGNTTPPLLHLSRILQHCLIPGDRHAKQNSKGKPKTMATLTSVPSIDSVSIAGSTAPAQSDNRVLPIFDAFLDLPHPAASDAVNEKRRIIAPPPGEAFNRSRDVGIELSNEQGLARVASFCFPEFNPEMHGEFEV